MSLVLAKIGRTGSSSGNSNLKLKEEVEFLKANLSALWDIVSALQTRAAEERQDESEELVVSLGPEYDARLPSPHPRVPVLGLGSELHQLGQRLRHYCLEYSGCRFRPRSRRFIEC